MQLGEKKLIVQRASLGSKNLGANLPATIQVTPLFTLLQPGFRTRNRPDPKLFGLKDPDPKLFISDQDPPCFALIYEIPFKILLKNDQIHHNYTHNT